MEKILEEKHREICGVIIEPMVQAAAGMKIYSAKYLIKLREACSYYNIHLIADEIAVGFGRTGKMFACEHGGIKSRYHVPVERAYRRLYASFAGCYHFRRFTMLFTAIILSLRRFCTATAIPEIPWLVPQPWNR